MCFDESPLAQAILDPSGQFIRVNKVFQTLFGSHISTHYHFQEIVDSLTIECTPRPLLSPIWKAETDFHFLIYNKADGTSYSCRLSPKHSLDLMLLMVDEVVSPSFYDNALRDTVGRLNSLLNCASVFICRVNMEGRYSYANESFLQHFGYTPETLDAEVAMETVHPDDAAHLQAAGMAVMVNPKEKASCRIRKPSADRSRYFATAWEFTAITNDAGEVCEIQCVGTDVTEESIKEERLAVYIKQLRQYNFEISHELRRPLTNLVGLVNLYNDYSEGEEDRRKIMNLFHENLAEMDAITRRLTNHLMV